MNTYETLYDSIRENEQTITARVYEAVDSKLKELGDGIYELDWANAQMKSHLHDHEKQAA